MNSDRLYQTLSLAAALLAWQLAVGVFGVVDPGVLPPPVTVFERTLTLLGEQAFLGHLSATIERTLLASVLAAVSGVSVGVIMGWNDTVKALLGPLFSAVYPIPVIALLPLVVLVFSTDSSALVFTAALGGFFVMLWNAMNGARQIRNIYFDVATDNGATSSLTIFREILLPGSLPAIFVGLRLAMNTALLIVISAELLAGGRGLGYYLWVSYQTYSLGDVYATLTVIAAIGVGITYGLRWIGDRLITWTPDENDRPAEAALR
ncbi:ABC transporter permease [Halorubrum lipolyticum]|uniref:Binding-protein-dependent transport system inner membrane protein n=1 Tax=Halorubrum lipolyticum DSM 21995 TaxID=1227482 RepID=M0NYJ7_9EURY|nr:ABC transporter permease [Halorubrum lipolyticum]EMA62901.1 binding-protein-dependent transport system inner membrane protein [Halorubrum lipolyticum DSM 21995]